MMQNYHSDSLLGSISAEPRMGCEALSRHGRPKFRVFNISQKTQGSYEMISGHSGTLRMAQLSLWIALVVIKINSRISIKNNKCWGPKHCPNLGPARDQTTPAQKSEAGKPKIDANNCENRPGVTLPSRLGWS